MKFETRLDDRIHAATPPKSEKPEKSDKLDDSATEKIELTDSGA